jgi:hypothetical protein
MQVVADPFASVSVAVPRIRSAPTPLRNWCSRWRSEFRSALGIVTATAMRRRASARRPRGQPGEQRCNRAASGTVATTVAHERRRLGQGSLWRVELAGHGRRGARWCPARMMAGRARRSRAQGRGAANTCISPGCPPHDFDHAGTQANTAPARQCETVSWPPRRCCRSRAAGDRGVCSLRSQPISLLRTWRPVARQVGGACHEST